MPGWLSELIELAQRTQRTQANQLDYTTPERACSSLDPGGTAR